MDLCAEVMRAACLMKYHADQHDLKFEFDMPGEFWVHADSALIRRLISNLVGNAIAHSPSRIRRPGGARCGREAAVVQSGAAADGVRHAATRRAILPHQRGQRRFTYWAWGCRWPLQSPRFSGSGSSLPSARMTAWWPW